MLNFKKNLWLSFLLIAMLTATGMLGGRAFQQLLGGAALKTAAGSGIYESLTTLQDTKVDEVTPDTQAARVVVNAPGEGVIGELIRFDLSASVAEAFKWLRVPETVDFEVYDNGTRAVFSARQPGEYVFVIACAYQGTVDVTTHVVAIIGPDPGPSPPDPDDNYPVIPVPADGASFVEWVPYWCSIARRPEAETLRLAASFESVAATIAAGINMTPQEIVDATSRANRLALGESITLWMPVLQNLQDALKTRAVAGTLVTVEQHAVAWREIATGLRAYADMLTVPSFTIRN